MCFSSGLRAVVVALVATANGVRLRLSHGVVWFPVQKLDPPNLATKVLYAHIGDDPTKWEVLTAFKRGASRAMRVKLRSSFTERVVQPYYCSMMERAPSSDIATAICTKPGGKPADKRSVYFHFPTHEDAMEFAEVWGNLHRYKTPVELTKEIPNEEQVHEDWDAVLERTRANVVEADGEVGSI